MSEEKKELNEDQKITQEFIDEYRKLVVKYKRDFKPVLQNNEQAIFANLVVFAVEDK